MDTWWLEQQKDQRWSMSLVTGKPGSILHSWCDENCFDPLLVSMFFYSMGRKQRRGRWEQTGEVCLQEKTHVGKAGCNVKSRAGAEC